MAIADGHSLAQRAVAPDLHIFVNKDIPEMINPQAGTDIHALWDADSSHRFGQAKGQPVQAIAKPSNQPAPPTVIATAEAIHRQRPNRLLLEERSGRIALQVGLPIQISH